MTDNLPAQTEQNLPTYFDIPKMNTRVKRLIGCLNCEWKTNNMCPYGCHAGPDKDGNYKATIPEMICKDRIEFLQVFLPPDKMNPTFEEWRRYKNTWQGQFELDHLFTQMKKLERQIQIMEKSFKEKDGLITDDSANRERFKWMQDEYTETWTKWKMIWETMRGIDTKEVMIDEKAKSRKGTVNIELSINDVDRLIRDAEKKIVDAEIVKEDEKK